MIRTLFVTCCLLISLAVLAQPAKKTPAKEKVPSQTEISKMMEDAMKDMSPEEKKQMKDAMKMAGQMQRNAINGNMTGVNVPQIPKKQTLLLSKLANPASQEQYENYLTGLLAESKKNIQPSVIAGVDKMMLQNSSRPEALVNLAPVLFLQKMPQASIYVAIKMAISRPKDVLVQDNLAVILHQTGYPQKALPVLTFLLQGNKHAVILNNAAQSYLALGDTANARKYFAACLRQDPNHCEANCGMGLLLTEEGNIREATPYIIRSLKNGYTETADALLQKDEIEIKYSDIKQKVPEYFNPQKYKPIPAAYSMEMVEPTEALRNELQEKMRFWMQKKEKINEEQRDKMDKESFSELVGRNPGFLSGVPFAKKAQLMIRLLGEEYGKVLAADHRNQRLPMERAYNAQMEKRLKDMYGNGQKYDNEYQECLKKIEILNDYLQLSAKNHEAYQQETLPDLYDWTNQSLYWWHFIASEEQYSIHFHNFISDFFEGLHEYDQMQTLYPTPLWIASTCRNVKEPEKAAMVSDSLDISCPVNIKIPWGAGSYKVNCKGMEIEGGELAVFGYEKDFQTGEFSFSFGLGAEANVPLFSVGTKGQMFFRFDKDFSPIDCGMKFESGGEANAGGYMVEEKMIATIGMASGIHVNALNMGKDINVFEMDPTK